MVYLVKQNFMAVELASYSAYSLDRDVRVIGDNDVMASVGDVFVIDKVALIRKEVSGGARVNA